MKYKLCCLFLMTCMVLAPGFTHAQDRTSMLEYTFQTKQLNPIPFDPKQTTADEAEVKYLGLFLQATQRAAVARTYRMLAIQQPSGGNAEKYTHQWYVKETNYILSSLERYNRRLKTPEKLKAAEDKFIEAVKLQQRVFEDIHLVKDTPVYRDVVASYKETVPVQKAHAALGASYAAMLDAFPTEPPMNKEAFRNSLLVVSFLDP